MTLLLLFFIPVLALAPDALAQTPPARKIDVRLLYVGHPGSDREKDFVQFLQQYFREVRTADLAKFDPAQTRAADVVLFDYDSVGEKAPRPSLPPAYTRPTVTIGIAGSFICTQRGLKTGFY
jgi:hypothetical protein